MNNNKIISINYKILLWARQRINMSIEEVAHKFTKDPESIKKWEETIKSWETGSSLPSLAQLEKLAYEVFQLPLAVFFLPEPPYEPPIKNQFRTISEYEITKLPSTLMLLIREGQYYIEVLKELFNGSNLNDEPIFKKINNITEFNLQNVAREIRNTLKINKSIQLEFKDTTEAFKYYRNQLEQNGIFVFQQTLKEYCRGYSFYDKEFPIIIVNSSEITDTGKNFTLFHELSHILFETGGITNEYSLQNQDSVEVLCNKLASHILVDDEEISSSNFLKNKDITNWSDDTLNSIAKEHKVSKEVILRRLLDMNLTTGDYYNLKRTEWLATISKKTKSEGGDYYLNKLSQLGYNYTSIIFNYLYSGMISEYQASDYLKIKINQIPQIESLVFK